MKKSKKIFLLMAVVFLILLIYASIDIASRTTFPGSKPQLKERIKKQFESTDSVKNDSIHPFIVK
jgi:hypothetical protein